MTGEGVFSDQDLSCYLDGEASETLSDAIEKAVVADPELVARLEALKAGEAAFADAMEAALAAAPVMPAMAEPVPAPANSPWRIGLASAAVGAIVAVGLSWNAWRPAEPGWRAVVANYQSLYVTETLELIDQSPAVQQADLQRLSREMGVDLAGLPEVEGLSFKRAQQLGFNGKPLAQLTFLTADGGPVALCIIRTGGDTSPGINAEVLSGLDAYNWTDNGYGVLLIGPKGQKGLKNAAEMFRTALKNASV